MKYLVFLLAFLPPVVSSQPLPFVTLQLRNGTMVTGISLTQAPADSTWIIFSTSSRFRRATHTEVVRVTVGNIDSLSYARTSKALLSSLARIELDDSTVVDHAFPFEVVGDTEFVFIHGGAKQSIKVDRVRRVVITRDRTPSSFPKLGLEYGAGLGCVWGVFFGNEEIPFGSRQESLKSFNQKIFGGAYNGAVWAVIGGGTGIVLGFLTEKAVHSTVTESLSGLKNVEKVQLIREVISIYSD